MLRLDILPRLIPDSYCVTWDEAIQEATERRTTPVAEDAVTRVDRSPYGGYRVYTVSLTMAMEFFADIADVGALPGSRSSVHPVYREEVPSL